ncbi:MAG: MBL fold metallo-hydrolase [Actinobacteria bacterium]|nr:MBL fold metallo-hydrolase [Actinomycetota bacterium]
MRVGSIELFAVPDAVGLLAEYGEAFSEVPDEAWDPYRALYPELFAGESWRVPCKCYLVRAGGVNVLVDTGVGPPGLWDWTAEQEGELPDALDRLGVRRDEIDILFLTHLHIDHVGWNTDLDGEAFFLRARYVVHRSALAFARMQAERPYVRRCILPLLQRFESIEGDVEIAPGVTAFLAPGHYPGHMALRLASEGAEAVLLADVAVHPALLEEPDWVYVSDGDPAECAETRRDLLPELVDCDVLVACGHYPGTGIGRVITRHGRVVWEEVQRR